MNCVFIGVMGKLLDAWMTRHYGKKINKLNSQNIREVSYRIAIVAEYCPSENLNH